MLGKVLVDMSTGKPGFFTMLTYNVMNYFHVIQF